MRDHSIDPPTGVPTIRSLPASAAVLIVGGGPVGLLLAALLDGLGVDNVVVERRDEPQAAPAAHVVNARTFEICRAAGLDMDAIDAACQPVADGAWARWVTSLTGDELGVVPFERLHQFDQLDAVTPTPLRNLSQHRFEPLLRDHVRALVTGVEWVSATPVEGGVVSVLRDVATDERREVRSTYLVAADGAGSPVRRSLGIEMDGPTRLKATISIHADADLRSLVADRPATLYWITDPACEGVFVAHDLDRTWVFMHDWDPDSERLADYTVERCADIFRRALGTDDVDVTIRSISPWTMTCQVATRYRDGQVFLIGDAAHRFPPTGGLGLNTGAVDAQNLAWKLAAVQHGWAEPSLLDTYEAERRPIAEANAQQSLANAVRTLEVPAALGATDDPIQTVTNYHATLRTPAGRARVRSAIENQAGHFDLLGLQLGYVYEPSAGGVLDDGTPLRRAGDPVRDYLPTTHPGARLPHAWVERAGQRVSTLDLVPPDRFVVLTASSEWARAGEQLEHAGVALDVVLVGRDVLDPDGHWVRLSEIGDDGALLVRPDQHVAWRSLGAVDDPTGALSGALREVVGARRATAALTPR